MLKIGSKTKEKSDKEEKIDYLIFSALLGLAFSSLELFERIRRRFVDGFCFDTL